MHFINNQFSALLLLLCVSITIPLTGMKRNEPEPNPLAVDNIQNLSADILTLIIKHLYPQERNIFCRVSKFCRSLAGKENQSLFYSLNDGISITDKVHISDMRTALRDCAAANNTTLYKHITESSKPAVHENYHKQILLETFKTIDPATIEFLVKQCPNHDFKHPESLYNQVLYLKACDRKKGCDTILEQRITTLEEFLDFIALKSLLHTKFLDVDIHGTECFAIIRNLFNNQQEATIQHIEDFWAKHEINQQSMVIREHCIRLLRYAIILNNTNMVKAILNTTPFQDHFATSAQWQGRIDLPSAPVIRYEDVDLYNAYRAFLDDITGSSNTEIWHAVFNWLNPTMLTDFTLEPIVDRLGSMGKYQEIRTFLNSPCSPIENLQSLLSKDLTRLNHLCTAFDHPDITIRKSIEESNVSIINFCKLVLDVAEILHNTLSDHTAKIGDIREQIIRLQTENAAIFNKLCNICHRLLSDYIKSTLISILDDPSRMLNLENYPALNRSTAPLVISIAQDLQEEYRQQSTTPIDPQLTAKIQTLEKLIKDIQSDIINT